jgi:hypothetical protein
LQDAFLKTPFSATTKGESIDTKNADLGYWECDDKDESRKHRTFRIESRGEYNEENCERGEAL